MIIKESDPDYIRIDEETGEIIPNEGFICDTPAKAEWVMGRLMAYAAAAKAAMHTPDALEAANVLAIAKANAEDWQKKYDKMLDYFKADLMQVAKANAEKGEKFLRTTYGRIQVRSLGPRLVISDESALMKWAREEAPISLRVEVDLKDVDDIIATLLINTDCVRVKFMPSLCPVNAAVVATGKVATPPGMKYIPAHEAAYVQLEPRKLGPEGAGAESASEEE